MIETYLQNKTNGNWTEEIDLTRAAIKEWNQIKPKFVVICGDLVNDYPGSEPRRSEQLRDFKKVFAELDKNIPLVLLGIKNSFYFVFVFLKINSVHYSGGNHDLLDSPTDESVDAYKSDFGDDYFSFWVDGCMFIVINVQFYKNHTQVEELHEEQSKWIDEKLEEAKNGSYKHVIVFQHIPWFLHNINEPLDPMVRKIYLI
jgi:3',5'-cyclic AMP phosphodiesterase CpdA